MLELLKSPLSEHFFKYNLGETLKHRMGAKRLVSSLSIRSNESLHPELEHGMADVTVTVWLRVVYRGTKTIDIQIDITGRGP